MEITLLGTGSPIPDPNRAGPSTLVRAGDVAVLADAGRGVVMRLAAAHFTGEIVLGPDLTSVTIA